MAGGSVKGPSVAAQTAAEHARRAEERVRRRNAKADMGRANARSAKEAHDRVIVITSYIILLTPRPTPALYTTHLVSR